MAKSLKLLIDGYNIIAPVAPPGRGSTEAWLHHERMGLLNRLVQFLPAKIARRCCVVFDARQPPTGRPDRFEHQGIDVRFAVDHDEADDLIEQLVASHHSPKGLAVVSSDRRIQTAARRKGATVFESQTWFDRLLDGRVGLAKTGQDQNDHSGPGRASELSSKPDETDLDEDEVQRWMRDFGVDPH
ncbi:NYN domain-containing protein [Crateriforma spongiae]|uniref:NYN domain-containing protein n=1 Tax=Crateriforma spongiae TaxID=2724528 RepID=UPI0039AEA5C9